MNDKEDYFIGHIYLAIYIEICSLFEFLNFFDRLLTNFRLRVVTIHLHLVRILFLDFFFLRGSV